MARVPRQLGPAKRPRIHCAGSDETRSPIFEPPLALPNINLARPIDTVRGLTLHLFPVGDPTRQTSERKHDGEHGGWNAHRAVNDAAVEIDVWIQFSFNEIFVSQNTFFDAFGEFEQFVVDPELCKNS